MLPATTEDALAVWASRGQNDLDAWAKTYIDSVTWPYRAALIDAVAEFGQITSVFEIGCHVGPNLYLLARRYPHAIVSGVDANEAIVARAREWLTSLPNVTVEAGDLRQALQNLPERSVDCVVSCYALAYISPSDLERVLALAWRAVRRGVVFLEPHGLATGETRENIEWRRNYAGIVQRMFPEATVHLRPLPMSSRHGALDALTLAVKS